MLEYRIAGVPLGIDGAADVTPETPIEPFEVEEFARLPLDEAVLGLAPEPDPEPDAEPEADAEFGAADVVDLSVAPKLALFDDEVLGLPDPPVDPLDLLDPIDPEADWEDPIEDGAETDDEEAAQPYIDDDTPPEWSEIEDVPEAVTLPLPVDCDPEPAIGGPIEDPCMVAPAPPLEVAIMPYVIWMEDVFFDFEDIDCSWEIPEPWICWDEVSCFDPEIDPCPEPVVAPEPVGETDPDETPVQDGEEDPEDLPTTPIEPEPEIAICYAYPEPPLIAICGPIDPVPPIFVCGPVCEELPYPEEPDMGFCATPWIEPGFIECGTGWEDDPNWGFDDPVIIECFDGFEEPEWLCTDPIVTDCFEGWQAALEEDFVFASICDLAVEGVAVDDVWAEGAGVTVVRPAIDHVDGLVSDCVVQDDLSAICFC